MKVVSKSDELELTEDSVVIRRRGVGNAIATGLNGDRAITISSITAVQMKRGGFLPGYILFAYAGSKPFYGGMIEATQDPDAFIFEGALNNQVSEFKTKLEELMRAAKASKSNVAPVSLADELSKLVTLRDSGVLSQDEFDAAKRKLLSG